MRKILLALALAIALLAGTAGAAGASAVTASKPAPLPVLYNLGGGLGSVWNNPQVKPRTFYIFADGSAAVIGMRWARWNHRTAVTRTATDYERTGPCCTKADQHYHKVTVTLSGVRSRGGPRPGPYFTKMVITGRGFRTLTYTYQVLRGGGLVIGSWIGGVSAGTAAASAPRLPVVHDAFGWKQNLIRPSFLGALHSIVPPKAIDGDFALMKLHWAAWGQRSARGTGRIGWAQPGPGGNGISRQAPVTVTLSAVAAHGGRPYFSRLAFRFTWRGHTYSGTERFADPCGNTAGCWVTPGTPVI